MDEFGDNLGVLLPVQAIEGFLVSLDAVCVAYLK